MLKFLLYLSALLWPEGDVSAMDEDPLSYRAGGSKGGF